MGATPPKKLKSKSTKSCLKHWFEKSSNLKTCLLSKIMCTNYLHLGGLKRPPPPIPKRVKTVEITLIEFYNKNTWCPLQGLIHPSSLTIFFGFSALNLLLHLRSKNMKMSRISSRSPVRWRIIRSSEFISSFTSTSSATTKPTPTPFFISSDFGHRYIFDWLIWCNFLIPWLCLTRWTDKNIIVQSDEYLGYLECLNYYCAKPRTGTRILQCHWNDQILHMGGRI